jgi:hypothetical protein
VGKPAKFLVGLAVGHVPLLLSHCALKEQIQKKRDAEEEKPSFIVCQIACLLEHPESVPPQCTISMAVRLPHPTPEKCCSSIPWLCINIVTKVSSHPNAIYQHSSGVVVHGIPSPPPLRSAFDCCLGCFLVILVNLPIQRHYAPRRNYASSLRSPH